MDLRNEASIFDCLVENPHFSLQGAAWAEIVIPKSQDSPAQTSAQGSDGQVSRLESPGAKDCVRLTAVLPDIVQGLLFSGPSIIVRGWMDEGVSAGQGSWSVWGRVPFVRDWGHCFIYSATERTWCTHGFEDFLGWSCSHPVLLHGDLALEW